ncbi:MAG: primosomal protein N' [Phycisphaerae bacterium]
MPLDRENKAADQLWLIPSEGVARTECVAEVALQLRTMRPHAFTVPEKLIAHAQVGSVVRVLHGRNRRATIGWIVRISDRPWDTTRRPIDEVVTADRLLDERLAQLALWISDYYACPPGYVCEAMVPAAMRIEKTRRVLWVRATAELPDKPLRGSAAVLHAVLSSGEALRKRELLALDGATPGGLRTLIKRGLAAVEERREAVVDEPPGPESDGLSADFAPSPEDQYQLTSGQAAALEAIRGAIAPTSAFGVHVLFGVPGSGKTEVYVRAIRTALAAGRQAILLIPEIALATQIAQRLARRFPRAAVLHSRLKPSERLRLLKAIAAGEIDVVVGTRTAVFAPLRRLGLIICDEEQESSFKSIASPYYHARDAAIKRAQIEGIPVVLGSATPSLETWHNATTLPHYRLLRLDDRVPGARFPAARRIETGQRELGQTTTLLSPQLIEAIRDSLAAGDQTILLHNRRGYAVHLRCEQCALVVRCERCGSALIEHRADAALKCHRCGRSEPTRTTCGDDSCGGTLERVGSGIQKLEEELKFNVPAARVLRLDSDTMKRREDYAAALLAFERREADILLGTQMVAKGLDFPGVRLVGVLDADSALALPDFRAAERVFQLLMQVAGRAGRREGESLALIQSASDPEGIISDAMRMDYETFAAKQLVTRREQGDPPFARLIRVVVSDEKPSVARDAAAGVADTLRRIAGRIHAGIRVSNGEPCVIKRLRGLARMQVLVHTPRDASGTKLLREADAQRAFFVKAERIAVDVDPVDML